MPFTARSITLSALVLLLLAACGSSPKVHYFSLSPMDSGYKQDSEDAAVLGFGPLRMPEYLNRSQIVTRGAGAELQVDEFNRWAEPLSLSLHRIASTDVDKLLDDVIVIAFPYESVIRTQVDYRLVGDVNRFDADRSGRVVLEVQWAVADMDAGLAVPATRGRYEAQAAVADDPGAIAVAMNRALNMFSREIASKLEAALQE